MKEYISYTFLMQHVAAHLRTEAVLLAKDSDIFEKSLNNELGVDLFGLGNAISFSITSLEKKHGIRFRDEDADDIGLDVWKYYRKSRTFRFINFFLPFVDESEDRVKPDLYLKEIVDKIWAVIPSDQKSNT